MDLLNKSELVEDVVVVVVGVVLGALAEYE